MKVTKVDKWLEEVTKEFIKPYDCAFSKTFGFIIMRDGRKAEVKVTIEMDEDNWSKEAQNHE